VSLSSGHQVPVRITLASTPILRRSNKDVRQLLQDAVLQRSHDFASLLRPERYVPAGDRHGAAGRRLLPAPCTLGGREAMNAFGSAIIMGAVLVLASATSEAVTWSINGSGCTPAPLSLHNNSFFVQGGAVVVHFDSTAIFNCPITERVPFDPVQLSVVNRGQTAPGSAAGTVATLIAVDRNTGLETTVTTVTASSLGSVRTTDSPFFSSTHVFNREANFYYVRVTMTSGSLPNQEHVLYGVFLRP
jgi:hypothetical protein